jgi:DHA1 family bicyclomycin/chloramphenicol resistance-like MFS transporter
VKSTEQKRKQLIMIFAPLLTFLSGITFDLHAPSLPAIASFFHTSFSAAKYTIPVTLLGFALGCIILGALFDIGGRRRIISSGLFFYALASFAAVFSPTIQFLLLMRFIQGLCIASVSIGCRMIIIDTLTGHDFKVAIVYTSLAFGLGPILAPFAGGYLQNNFGWQANFVVYGIVSVILLSVYLLFIGETKHSKNKFLLKKTLASYTEALKHPAFFSGSFIVGLAQIQLFVYTTCGAFLVENVMHRTAITYGNTALIVSCGYFVGTLINRLLIKNNTTYFLVCLGFVLLTLSILIQIGFALWSPMNLFAVVLPIALVGFSNGFVFVNIYSYLLRMSTSAGVTTALLTATIMTFSTLGTFALSHIHVKNLNDFALIFTGSLLIQLAVFTWSLASMLKCEENISCVSE